MVSQGIIITDKEILDMRLKDIRYKTGNTIKNKRRNIRKKCVKDNRG